jgi:hypothetical protein
MRSVVVGVSLHFDDASAQDVGTDPMTEPAAE